MLSPLLAVLLSAAPDSASSTDLLAQRAADSAALERISPLPATTESPASTAPRRRVARRSPDPLDADGPLEHGSVGLGFRVLGDEPRLHVQLALSSSTFVRLRGAFSQRSETHSRHLTETVDYNNGLASSIKATSIDVEQSSTEWEVQLAIGGLGRCQGSLCGSWSLGPFLGRTISTTENPGTQSIDFQIRERRLEKRLGMAGTLGLVWEFRKGLALSADAGASMARVSGEESTAYRNSYSNPVSDFESGGDPEGSELSADFVGVGLDAWF